MQIHEIKSLFSCGELLSAFITPRSGKFVLSFITIHNTTHCYHLQRGGVRLFKSTDSALAAAKDIGFDDVVVKQLQSY